MFYRVQADIYGSLGKTRFAVAEVIIPEPPKALIEAEQGNRLPPGMEALAPFCQCERIGLSEKLRLREFQAGLSDGFFKR